VTGVELGVIFEGHDGLGYRIERGGACAQARKTATQGAAQAFMPGGGDIIGEIALPEGARTAMDCQTDTHFRSLITRDHCRFSNHAALCAKPRSKKMDDELIVAAMGAVRVLRLNRSDKLNALNPALLTALGAAFGAIEADDTVRAVLLTGTGRGFCVGADLTQNQGGGLRDLGASIEQMYNPLVRRIRALNRPVIAAVNGVAAGAGVNLALAADIVLAAESASFIQAFVRIGLIPDAGGTWFLPHLIGDARARGLAMTGEAISAQQAMDWGMIWRCLPDEGFAEAALDFAQAMAARPTQSLAAMKRAFNQAATQTLDAQLDLERDLQRVMGRTPDFIEGVRAFIEKRPAQFTGAPPQAD
jgi:2-(1,2-epoxy-1,2-dihydrophenyl)acetyl-CoA isomerase